MRFRKVLLVMIAMINLICSIGLGEELKTDSISFDEWDWDNESVNVFNGSIDLSRWNGTELTLEMKAAFEPESVYASETVPKFTHFNGSRLTMLEQKDNITCTPETDKTPVTFAGSLQMPEKDHFRKITIDLAATDAEGKELKKISVTITRNAGAASQTGNILYIPFEIRTIAIFIAAGAAIIWCIAVIRNRILNRK